MKYIKRHLAMLPILLLLISCNNIESQSIKEANHTADQFNNYWYDGNAEITRYELKQSRYGEIHDGDAVLIFVTEEFRTDKQVKYEGGDRKNVVPILKLNMTKKFLTGLYPYSIMSSIFTPIDINKKTIKVSTTSQEWCGHTFSQLNRDGGDYSSQVFSYFQNEGDEKAKIKDALTEDGLWTTVRLNPNSLPTGDINIIPSTQFLRLKHLPTQKEKATATIIAHQDETLSDKLLSQYILEYSNIDRVLEITYESVFPYHIVAWKEKSKSGRIPSTTAVRSHQIKSAYWGQNGNGDRSIRSQLGLK